MNAITQTRFYGDMSRLKPVVNILQRLDRSFFEKEIDSIYRQGWLPVASGTDVLVPNSYVVAQVPPLRTSLVVTRDEAGKVHAFYNICRHRGAKLVRNDGGCRKALTCGFHGWTFASDGRLIGVTDKTQFEDIDPSKLGLIEVHAEEWEDYIFVNFAEKPAMPLAQWPPPLCPHSAHGAVASSGWPDFAPRSTRHRWNATADPFRGSHQSWQSAPSGCS